jgi:hypothetical protein
MDTIKNERIRKNVLIEKKRIIIKTKKIRRIIIQYLKWQVWTYDK